jgi:hypothetical protein
MVSVVEDDCTGSASVVEVNCIGCEVCLMVNVVENDCTGGEICLMVNAVEMVSHLCKNRLRWDHYKPGYSEYFPSQ